VTNGPYERRSIFSGLLLILLGALFLVARFNPDFHLWHVFWRFSPLLLILWGVAKLIDNFAAQRSGQLRPPLLNGGEAALLVLIVFVLGGMAIYSKIREKNPDLSIDMSMFNQESSQSHELPAKSIPAGSHVTIETSRGNVNVHAGDGTELRVNASETAHASNESTAEHIVKDVQIAIDKTPDGYLVHPINQDVAHASISVDFEVTVPKSSTVTIHTGHGDVNVADVVGALTVSSVQGDIEIHDCGSDVSAALTKGDVRITNAKGNVHVTGKGNEVEVTGVAGDATVNGEFFGPIRVRDVGKTTHYQSQKADLVLVHLTGLLELDSRSVEISDVGGLANLATQNKDIEVENVAGKLNIADTNGSVKVGYAQPPKENISIANDSGEVDLTLPSESTFEISAISKSGEVQSDFDNPSLVSSSDNGTGKLVGKVGASGPKINIVTSYGTININKSS
jgi:hypothetical protein